MTTSGAARFLVIPPVSPDDRPAFEFIVHALGDLGGVEFVASRNCVEPVG
jgi:hypothetical protein